MSDQPPDMPKYKYVDGELHALSVEEIDAVIRERVDPPVEPPPEPKSEPHAHSRTKRR